MTDYQRVVEDRWSGTIHAAACMEAVSVCDWDAVHGQYVLVTDTRVVRRATTSTQLLRVRTYSMCGSRVVSLFWRGTCVFKVSVRTMRLQSHKAAV